VEGEREKAKGERKGRKIRTMQQETRKGKIRVKNGMRFKYSVGLYERS